MTTPQDIPDLTKKRPTETIKFKIDNDVFEAYPAVGGAILSDITDASEFIGLINKDPKRATTQDLEALAKANHAWNTKLMNFLDAVLLPDSVARFVERLRSGKEPIDLEQTREVIRLLIERYSKDRPTEPSFSSQDGHDGTNTNSMDTVRVAE